MYFKLQTTRTVIT